jgi:hypothetical protein
VKGSFVKKGKYYCSRKCLNHTLPKCHLCKQAFRQGVVIKNPQGNKVYCQSCGALNRCFACSLPAASGTRLDDGRFLGAECGKTAIFSEAKGKELFEKIRAKVASKLNYKTSHKIYFRLVDSIILKKASANYEPGLEMGLFKHNYTIKTKIETSYSLFKGKQEKKQKRKTNHRYSVLVLTGLPKKKFIEVCAHELGHDWMDENFPKIKDLKLKEGWAEYFASEVNKLYEQKAMNKRIETNPSKVYGDGYRFIRDYLKKYGMKGLKKYLKQQNK